MLPALKALVAQIIGWLAAIVLARAGLLPGAGLWPLVAVQAVAAAGAAAALRSAGWWLPIHLAFSPLLFVARSIGIAPGWYLAAFVVLVAFYWTSFRTQVPLYLTNGATVAAVAALLPAQPMRLLDVGSGTGALVRPLARLRPDCRFHGIEAAPAPYWLSRLLARGCANLGLERGDFFAPSWTDYDVVYAFLSPVPMARVWRKAEREMRPGGLFVSNSFAVPGVTPERVVVADDRRGTQLFVYRLGRPPK